MLPRRLIAVEDLRHSRIVCDCGRRLWRTLLSTSAAGSRKASATRKKRIAVRQFVRRTINGRTAVTQGLSDSERLVVGESSYITLPPRPRSGHSWPLAHSPTLAIRSYRSMAAPRILPLGSSVLTWEECGRSGQLARPYAKFARFGRRTVVRCVTDRTLRPNILIKIDEGPVGRFLR